MFFQSRISIYHIWWSQVINMENVGNKLKNIDFSWDFKYDEKSNKNIRFPWCINNSTLIIGSENTWIILLD
jgi:hypothetical protein